MNRVSNPSTAQRSSRKTESSFLSLWIESEVMKIVQLSDDVRSHQGLFPAIFGHGLDSVHDECQHVAEHMDSPAKVVPMVNY